MDNDVRDHLPRVRCPTLVMHRRGDRMIRVDAGRYLARCIPGARLAELEGEDHWFWCGDTTKVLDELQGFLREIDRLS